MALTGRMRCRERLMRSALSIAEEIPGEIAVPKFAMVGELILSPPHCSRMTVVTDPAPFSDSTWLYRICITCPKLLREAMNSIAMIVPCRRYYS